MSQSSVASDLRKTDADAKVERKAKRFYIGLVLFLFAIQASIMTAVITMSIGDPGGAVMPNYYQAGLQWDQTKQSRTASDRLGWSVDLEASDVVDGSGKRALLVSVVDAQQKGIDSLAVAGKLYHLAAADDIIESPFVASGEGRYLALLPVARPGSWKLELNVDGAGQPRTESIDFTVD